MSKPHRRRTPPNADALIADLAQQAIDLDSLSREHSIEPPVLLRWCASASARKRFDQHAALYAATAHLALLRASAKAAHALLELAQDHASPETARKACVDLIKLAPHHTQPPTDQPPRQDDEAVLRVLSDKLTQTTEHHEP